MGKNLTRSSGKTFEIPLQRALEKNAGKQTASLICFNKRTVKEKK
jgi:hypothetical protein